MDAATLWPEILANLKKEVSEPVFKIWFGRLSCIELGESFVVVGCPNALTLKQLEAKFRKQFESVIKKLIGHSVDVQFTIQEEIAAPIKSTPLFDQLPQGMIEETNNTQTYSSTSTAVAKPTISPLNPNYTFDQFVVGGTNRVAHAAALAVTDNPGKNYNPFFIYGGTGVGKTHLVQAIGNALVHKKPNTKVIYCSIERFMNDFIDSIRFKTTNEFKRRYRSCDILIVDDIQFIAGNKESTQEEFFHTYNELHESGRQIILCSDRPPRDIATLTDRLVSRFEGGLTVDIALPDFETRSAIIRAKADALHLNLSSEIADYVASLASENIRIIEGMMLKLQSFSFSQTGPLNLQLVQSILGQAPVSPIHRKQINPNELLKLICETYGITLKELLSKKRTQTLVTPRQIAMYLLRQDLNLNLETIGAMLGGRDHTTIMHGIDKISKLASSDEQTKSAILALRQTTA
jgi:chromosomal replication initiator protein